MEQNEGNRYLEQARSIVVIDNNTYDLASAYTEVLNKKIKTIKDYFSPRKAKAKAVHQEWVDAEKESLKPFIEAKGIVHTKAQVYLIQKQKEQEELLKQTKEAAEEAGVNKDLVRAPDLLPKTHKRVVYKWRVKDFSKVPDEYKLIDEQALNKLATKTKGEAWVDGIEFFKSYIAI